MLSNAYSGMRSVPLSPSDRLLSFLPLSHTLERTVGYYAALISGSSVTFNRSIKQLNDDFQLVKPTVLISVPRIFERVHNQIYSTLVEAGGFQKLLFNNAVGIGWHRFQYQQGLVKWSPKFLFSAAFDLLVAKKVKQQLGGALRFVIVGGAPLTEDVAKTFISLGIPLLQGYGLTESSPIVSSNTLEQNRVNSIGMLLRGVNIKIADNDELWVHGDNVMQGYWQRPEASAKALVVDNDKTWLRTGDRAAIDQQGFLRMPPPDIEAAIARNPLFTQVMIVGEGKSFLSALVVLNDDLAKPLQLAHGDGFHDYLIEQVAAQMDDFPGYAKIRKIHVCPKEWTVESGLLTPTLKIKRPKIMAYYEHEIASLYAGHGVHKS